MQYSILSRFGVYLDDKTPAKTLLYFYSTLKKDEREREQKRRMTQDNTVYGTRRRVG